MFFTGIPRVKETYLGFWKRMCKITKISILALAVLIVTLLFIFLSFSGLKSQSNQTAYVTIASHSDIGNGVENSKITYNEKDLDLEPLIITFNIDDYIKSLNTGDAIFNVPETMKLKDKAILIFAISPNEYTERYLFNKGKVEYVKIKVSERMKATLKGTGFEIINMMDSEEQLVSLEEETLWRWQISPTNSGTQTLFLDVYAIVEKNNKDEIRQVKTFTKTINVEISPIRSFKHFVKTNWQFFASGIFIPIFVWYWNNKRRLNRHHE